MMRSLWSGVSGLNAHQTGIDVEGNNIANVNTVGFKYSRTNFEDYMSQTTSPSVSPQGKSGGTNATQIGSGATVASVQKIFSQGATQGTDSETDMAINGQGFFIMSNDGGKTYSYTRAGNFDFDANGNLVDPNGNIVQGWLADENYEINATGGLKNITIDPGITTPAKATSEISIVANLNSGTEVGESGRSPAATTVTATTDFDGLFDYKGDEIELKKNIDTLNLILTRTFDVNGVATESTSTHVFTYGESATESDGFFTTIQDLLDEINFRIEDSTGIHDNKVLLTGEGQIAAAGHIVAVNGSSNPKTADSTADMNTIRTFNGESAGFAVGEQIEITYDTTSGLTGTAVFTYGTDFTTIDDLITAINTAAGGAGTVSYNSESGFLSDDTGLIRNARALDSVGDVPAANTDLGNFNSLLSSLGGAGSHSYTLRGEEYYTKPTTNSLLVNNLQKATEGYFLSRSFKVDQNSFTGADDVGELFNPDGEAIMLKAGEGISFSVGQLGETRNFVYRDPDSDNINSYFTNNFQDDADITIVDETQGFRWMKNEDGDDAFMKVGERIVIDFDSSSSGIVGSKTYTYGVAGDDGFNTIEDLLDQINSDLLASGRKLYFDDINGWIQDSDNVVVGMSVVDETGSAPIAGTPLDKLNTMLSTIDSTANSHTEVMKKNSTYYFTDLQELANLYQDAIDDAGSKTNYELPIDADVSIDDGGRIVIENSGTGVFEISTSGFPNDLDTNTSFYDMLSKLDGTVSADGKFTSQRFTAATHATSVEVFDSSGSKIQVTLNFRKDQTASSNGEATVWKFYAEAPEPATFEYPSFGEIQFNADGSLRGFSPPSVTLNANTGGSSGQGIQLDFGSLNGFNGLTSFADDSETRRGFSDGYAGGSLKEVTVDKTGTIIGGFSNGKTFKLAQVGIATFANNAGLVTEGGNQYSESANSGNAQVGTAGTSNRGTVAPMSLEMSNVDLSQSLTNLIVIQRGFQANSKTITTSDQMLNTLLQLKQ